MKRHPIRRILSLLLSPVFFGSFSGPGDTVGALHFAVMIVRGFGPPVQECVQRISVLIRAGAAILPGVAIDGHPMMIVRRKVDPENAVSGPAPVTTRWLLTVPSL